MTGLDSAHSGGDVGRYPENDMSKVPLLPIGRALGIPLRLTDAR